MTTVRGGRFRSVAVVSVTGGFAGPHWLDLPGLADFTGRVWHAVEYRRSELFVGECVVVVGGGNFAV